MATIAFVDENGDIENMHAAPLPDGTFRLDNVPFRVCGISLGDEFRVVPKEGRLFFEEIVRRSGHSTYRVRLAPERSHDVFLNSWSSLEEAGCTFEGSDLDGRRLYAIDVPPEADVTAVYKKLEEGEERGIWQFEEGHYAGEL